MPAIAFIGGDHVPTYPKADALRQSARDWAALADEHNKAALAAIESGDHATALLEFRLAAAKTGMAARAAMDLVQLEGGQ